jgi:predicted transcriptional regulator
MIFYFYILPNPTTIFTLILHIKILKDNKLIQSFKFPNDIRIFIDNQLIVS